MAPFGTWDEELVGHAWFDPGLIAVGLFDAKLVGTAGQPGEITPDALTIQACHAIARATL